jgi:hypothetical protein
LEIELPNNWQPRPYQLPAWEYLENGGKLAYLIWHRRSGKDDTILHWAATAAHQRVGNYWHMLPQGSQARKAVWDAINPHTGIRRINEAFPLALRETTRENEMLIKFKVGSTWQVVGSDNYDSLVGSPPIGVVFSEWALAKPQSYAYLQPILEENGGWAAFITTPRGNNHAARMFKSMQQQPGAFVQKLTAVDTGIFTAEKLEQIHQQYIRDYGQAEGQALFDQEYMCAFEAPVIGAIYAKELERARAAGRICITPYDSSKLVHTAWDIGWGDSTAIWFWQWIAQEPRIIDYYECRGEPITHYLSRLQSKGYQYDTLWLPHDAENGQLATGKSIAEIVRENGFKVEIAPKLSVEDGINAVRLLLGRCYFDEKRCEAGLEALQNYRWDYNERLDEPKRTPVHDWSSHGSDAFRYLALVIDRSQGKRKMAPLKLDTRGVV